ncbi:MAG: threonine--tRNA ligase [Firmicutes bacterium]|nr:threonine--tRNA ligase [Bacillota bacterium]
MKIEEIKDLELKHSASHVLAMAVKNIYPTVKLGIGPAIANGFYYDFDFATPIKMEDLPKIEAEMQRLIKQGLVLEAIEKTRADAKKLLEKQKEPYKLELLNDIARGEKIMFYKLDNFIDLCAGPHLAKIDKIKAFKLTQITGAYWRGDSKSKMLTRIYGVAFNKQSELEAYELQQEEIKKRDHNRIGRELELFTAVDLVGQGLPHMMPKGAKILQILQRFVEDEEERRGYMHVKTPLFAKKELYELSGHWNYYKDGMFVIGNELLDDEVFALRPMTCPFHFFIYKQGIKSYRDLPIRYGETSTLFRNESSGEMHGLTRVRQFTLSEGHIVLRSDQIQQVIDECVDLIKYMMNILGIADKITYRLSKWDSNNRAKYIGKAEDWERSQNELRSVLQRHKLEFVEVDGDAAFYGPKIDLQARNVYGKEDTILTIQLDFALGPKYEMTYMNEQGERVAPVIIHRTSVGCYERTLAMLIENTMGAFPVWLSPTQAVIMGISNRHDDYVENVYAKLKHENIRIEKDIRAEKVGYKIREHTKSKVPFILIAGDKEAETNTISIRTREGEDLGSMTADEFIKLIKEKVDKFQ